MADNGNGNGNAHGNGNGSHLPPSPAIRRLRCRVQHYDWGRLGDTSLVARLSTGGASVETIPYAELWMGTHPSGASFIVGGGGDDGDDDDGSISLREWIERDPRKLLGPKVADKWGPDLPFLFKVLSVAKALSIQAHPDKALAERLHASRPSVYKDPNHKPEMAIAVTEFQALCGFVSLKELKVVLMTVPEVVDLVNRDDALKLMEFNNSDGAGGAKSLLQSIFTKLMSANDDVVSDAVSRLKSRLHVESKVRELHEKEKLALLLEKQYPGDIGVLAAFFFNYIKLKPGEAVYLAANEPHAYISGECIECMAASDNVVRAGLTPKFRDVQTLCSMLTYNQEHPEILRGYSVNPYITRYIPPFSEFEVDRIQLPSGASLLLPATPGPSVFIVLSGEGKVVDNEVEELTVQGNAFFLPANHGIKLEASEAAPLQLYRAGVNSRFLA